MTNSTAPTYRKGDDVIFHGRPSKVIAVSARPGIITVSNDRGAWMIGTSHSALAKVGA